MKGDVIVPTPDLNWSSINSKGGKYIFKKQQVFSSSNIQIILKGLFFTHNFKKKKKKRKNMSIAWHCLEKEGFENSRLRTSMSLKKIHIPQVGDPGSAPAETQSPAQVAVAGDRYQGGWEGREGIGSSPFPSGAGWCGSSPCDPGQGLRLMTQPRHLHSHRRWGALGVNCFLTDARPCHAVASVNKGSLGNSYNNSPENNDSLSSYRRSWVTLFDL